MIYGLVLPQSHFPLTKRWHSSPHSPLPLFFVTKITFTQKTEFFISCKCGARGGINKQSEFLRASR